VSKRETEDPGDWSNKGKRVQDYFSDSKTEGTKKLLRKRKGPKTPFVWESTLEKPPQSANSEQKKAAVCQRGRERGELGLCVIAKLQPGSNTKSKGQSKN